MKNLLYCFMILMALGACGQPNSSDAIQNATEVNIPVKGDDWIDHPLNAMEPGLIISTPPDWTVWDDSYAFSVIKDGDENVYLSVMPEKLDIKDEKQWYVDSESREDLEFLIDTDTEVLYTGTDLSAPSGHQHTNSFFANNNVGGKTYSTNVDGITIESSDNIHNLSMEDCQLLLGIFRTIRMK